MMEELSLTGATLMSGDSSTRGLELSSLPKDDPLAQPSSSSHDHSHSHSHQGGKPCCGSHGRQTPLQPMVPINVNDVMAGGLEEQFKTMSTYIRVGTFNALKPLTEALVEAGSISGVVSKLGEDGHSLFHWASKRSDDIRFLSFLCENASKDNLNVPSSDAVGMRPIHWACTEGSIPHIAMLLKHGADIEGADLSGCTPLLISAQYGQVELVGYLLQKKANLLAIDKNSDTALHWACYKGSMPVCGLLLYQGLGNYITKPDSYGQTPLHLGSLRGNTSVVRYILQESSLQQRRTLLTMEDSNGKTPLDLAIKKNRPTVQAVLREAEGLYLIKGSREWWPFLKKQCGELFSLHSWKLWLGCHSINDESDESAKLPFFITILHMTIACLTFPLLFTPFDSSKGLLWDKPWLHVFTISNMVIMWYALYKTNRTNPGLLDENNSTTKELRRQYEQTLESYSDDAFIAKSKEKPQLCHTCHIAKPLRSKHCRVMRRCVLMFDHHCPFVGTTIGLYNYKWFYLFLFTITMSYLGFFTELSILNHRQFRLGLLFYGLYMFLYFLMGAGMLMYHTQLSLTNLTTNEHQNLRRYKYLQNSHGAYFNPFFRGLFGNFMDRMFPTEASYTCKRRPREERSLITEKGGSATEVAEHVI